MGETAQPPTDAPGDGRYRIFISHKHEDESAALAVRDAIGQFSGSLEFFISGESIVEGENWRARLRQELKDSDLLLLLFTHPTENWDWCLYEVGLFESLEQEQRDEPVVCIYSPAGDPPSPLAKLQGVEASPNRMAQFLHRLIKTTEITRRDAPINPNVTEQNIERAARAICDLFSGNVSAEYTCHRVVLRLPVRLDYSSGIPRNATISTSEDTTRLFGRTAGTDTWGELVQRHAEEDAPWLSELNRAFSQACEGELSDPVKHTFRDRSGVRVFRPELYRLDRKGRTPVSAVVIFTEEIAPAKVGGPIFNRLRTTERYRSEVFVPLDRGGASLPEDKTLDLARAFERIREESQAHNVFDDETLRTSFADGDIGQLEAIGEAWRALVTRLRESLRGGDAVEIREILGELRVLNDRYRAIVSHRYAEVIEAPAAAAS
jgi:hypothetical protein